MEKGQKNLILLLILGVLTIGIGVYAAFNWDGIQGMILGKTKINMAADTKGKPITLQTNQGQVTIPPVMSEDVFGYLQKNMVEKGGLPVKVDRKGNALPFGIP